MPKNHKNKEGGKFANEVKHIDLLSNGDLSRKKNELRQVSLISKRAYQLYQMVKMVCNNFLYLK